MNDTIYEESWFYLLCLLFIIVISIILYLVELQLGKKVEIFLDFIKTIRFKDGFNDAQLENRFLKETWLELTKEVGRFKEYLSEIKKEIDEEELKYSQLTKKGSFKDFVKKKIKS
jgi:hypothetical protein